MVKFEVRDAVSTWRRVMSIVACRATKYNEAEARRRPISSSVCGRQTMTTTPCSTFGRETGLSLLEQLPQDVINDFLSFLYLDEFEILSLVSKCVNAAVSSSRCLVMSESPQGRKLSALHSEASDSVKRRKAVPEAHVDEAGLRRLLGRFTSLNVLHLHGLARVGDSLFAILNESPTARTLKKISLHGCYLSYWCPTSLQLQNLTHVTISGGSIRSAFRTFTSSSYLQSLSIAQCASLRDENIADMATRLHNRLENLTLQQCLRIRKPVLQFERLQTLNLIGCFALTDLPRFSCPALREFGLSFCFGMDGQVIQDIVNRSEHLERLSLIKCPGLETLTIRSKTLRSLNLSFSNGLHTLHLVCANLASLETPSCRFLTSLQLVSNQIEKVRLSSACLAILRIESVSLEALDLSGCKDLYDSQCHIRCPQLTKLDICGTTLSSNVFGHSIPVVQRGATKLTGLSL